MSAILRLAGIAGSGLLVAFLGLLVSYLLLIDLSPVLPRSTPFIEPIVGMDAIVAVVGVRWLMRKPALERGRHLAQLSSVLGSTLAILSAVLFIELELRELVEPATGEGALGAAGASFFAMSFMALGAGIAAVGFFSARSPRS